MEKLYTIGHSQHSLEKFLCLVKKYNINYIFDVRSTPYSKFAKQFNQNVIGEYLHIHGIVYKPMGKFFGARQEDKSLYTEEGYLDFQKTRDTLLFRRAEESVMLGINRGYKIALMCAEKDPIDCHRTILVSKAFYDSGVPVEHILENGNTMNQEAINERLLNMYFSERAQLSIFDYINGGVAEEELLEKAYVLRNKDIGYYINSTPLMAKLGGR